LIQSFPDVEMSIPREEKEYGATEFEHCYSRKGEGIVDKVVLSVWGSGIATL
jgi:hypothetical protein